MGSANGTRVIEVGYPDYRTILQQELDRRRRNNPLYSQRAFARDLGLRSNRLSEVLRGKQGLSLNSASQLAQRLGLGGEDAEYFCTLVRAKHSRSPVDRVRALRELRRFRQAVRYRRLQLDTFQLISQWWHLAILELTKVKDFVPRADWIAARLGLDTPTIEAALDRPHRAELIGRESGAWVFPRTDCVIPGGVPAESIRRFHAEVMARATESLKTLPLAMRDFRTVFLAVDPDRLPAMKERVDSFWKAFDREFGQGENRSEVYSIGIQLFPLTEAMANAQA